MVEYALNQQKEYAIKPDRTILGRDYSIYRRELDAAVLDKKNRLTRFFGELPEQAVVIDVGSGTGQLTELIAREYRGARVFAVDNSHVLLEMAEEKPLIHLIWDDARELAHIPDNSVDLIYSHTTSHEVFSKFGRKGLESMFAAAFRVLKPGGRFVLADMLKPTYTGNVFMRIDVHDGLDNIEAAKVNGFLDYSKLSTRALFLKFHEEFLGGGAFQYKIHKKDGVEYFYLPAEYAHEFSLHKDYGANWGLERDEKYTWGDTVEAKSITEAAGFKNVLVVLSDSQWIRKIRLRGKVTMFIRDANKQQNEVEFTTHMVIVADKPGVRSYAPGVEIRKIDYDKLLETIKVDEKNHVALVGEKTFRIGKYIGEGAHRRVYENLGRLGTLIKIVRSDEPDIHNVFKSMTQAVDRQNVRDEYQVEEMKIVDYDRQGPPYRYLVQEILPTGSEYADVLIRGEGKNIGLEKLTERDIRQIAEIVNRFELKRRWQLDMSPFNWARVTDENGETQMVYTGSTVYDYDENWAFAKMGLLEWSDGKYVPAGGLRTAVKPTRGEIKEFLETLADNDNWTVQTFLKYLSPAVVEI